MFFLPIIAAGCMSAMNSTQSSINSTRLALMSMNNRKSSYTPDIRSETEVPVESSEVVETFSHNPNEYGRPDFRKKYDSVE